MRTARNAVAYGLMAGGSISALLIAAGPLQRPGLLVAFVLCLALIAAGAWLRRRAGHDPDGGDGGHEALGRARAALEALQARLRAGAGAGLETPRRAALLEALSDCETFADERQAMLDRFGVGPYAQLMTAFAGVERSLARSLSALDDGYPAEAAEHWRNAVPMAELVSSEFASLSA